MNKQVPFEKTNNYGTDFAFLFSSNSKDFACIYSKADYEKYLIVGKEKLGPYFYISSCSFSDDGKALEFEIIDDEYCDKVYIDGTVYTGSICGDKVIYLKDNKIMMR